MEKVPKCELNNPQNFYLPRHCMKTVQQANCELFLMQVQKQLVVSL